MANDLQPLFEPRSIAVIGASRKRATVGGEIFHNLLANGFEGPVYPVNPTAKTVQSVKAWPTITDIPDPIDLAVIVVAQPMVQAIVEACGRKGVKGIIVISAGFGETGEAGRKIQDKLTATVRQFGMRMVGPNCLGVLNTDPKVKMDATFAPTWPPTGRVSFSSQSGALGLAILDYAAALGIGVRTFVSIGNKADLSGNDLIEHWENDPETDVILLYLESFGNPGKFTRIARRVSRKKPIAAVKSGRSSAGARAASSHTGALAGADTAVDALFRTTGVIRTDTIEELFDMAMLLANQPVPSSNRVAIITNAGGPGIMATDACEAHGLVIPALSDATTTALRSFLPGEASVKNPVDMIASASADHYKRAVKLVLDDPNVDSLLVIFVPPIVTDAHDVAAAIREGLASATHAADKTVLGCFLGTRGVPEALASLQAGKIPSYAFPEAAAMALSRAVAYGRWKAKPEGVIPKLDVDPAAAKKAIESARARLDGGVGWLDPEGVRDVLSAYGIRTPATARATSVDDAARVAEKMGFPVAVKLDSKTITHKSDVGGVKLNLRDAAAVRAAWDDIGKRLDAIGKKKEMDGVVVQQMAPDGVETIVGANYDSNFGHVVMYGLGGVQVELLKDVSWGVTPLTDRDAAEMVEQVKGSKLLEGYRGAPVADTPALRDVLLRVSQLVTDFPEIGEMDLNPVRVLPQGKGAVAVDARLKMKARTP
ncbi:MAG TPA: acetate--CoA ligase family protein [bacterium]|nr:acetate--CoA ligase family protein [bacterium]